ncbi:GDNF family receptor alpha-like [Cololabis saira]|uniref:GDNF family receptor alpha-like n=1 Tax=Cololabis saira TaxID=129043 RepID=UPI002AD484B5|nr:GDNF family receptor alpha-like [Cololabis saira]
MQLRHLEAAAFLGIVIPQICCMKISSPASDCLPAVDTCMSDLCKLEKALYAGVCKDEECQIKSSEVCNLTIQTAMNQFPALRGCVCAWEEEFCDSIQVLAKQCPRMPVIQKKTSEMMDWQSSNLIDYVYDAAGSCVDRIGVCLSDSVCNRHLVPVLQACEAEQCSSDHCQQETQQFYTSMPQNAAIMLVMCECEASEQSCQLMKTAVQTGTCGEETRICQERLGQCVEDATCRNLLKTFQAKCWSPEEAECSERNLRIDECFTLRDPALILGTHSDCRRAFLATLGTVLHHRCTCKGVHTDHLPACRMIRDVFHNRSHFIPFRESSGGPTKPPEIKGSEHAHTWSYDHLLYSSAAVLLTGVVLFVLLVVVSKIWLLRRKKLRHPQKRDCIVIF